MRVNQEFSARNEGETEMDARLGEEEERQF